MDVCCPQRLAHGFRADRQVTDAGAAGGENRVRDGGGDRRCRRLAETDRHLGARHELDFHLRNVAHAHGPASSGAKLSGT
jgi:hypothetical protein